MEFSRQEYWRGFATSFSRGSSRHRDRIRVSYTAGKPFTQWATHMARCSMLPAEGAGDTAGQGSSWGRRVAHQASRAPSSGRLLQCRAVNSTQRLPPPSTLSAGQLPLTERIQGDPWHPGRGRILACFTSMAPQHFSAIWWTMTMPSRKQSLNLSPVGGPRCGGLLGGLPQPEGKELTGWL